MKKFTVRMEDEDYKVLKEFAEERGESMSDVVNQAVARYVKGEEAVPPVEPVAPTKKTPAVKEVAAKIPAELLALPGKIEKLEEESTKLKGGMARLTADMVGLKKQVDNFLSVYELITRPSVSPSFMGRSAEGGEKKVEKKRAKKPKK